MLGGIIVPKVKLRKIDCPKIVQRGRTCLKTNDQAGNEDK